MEPDSHVVVILSTYKTDCCNAVVLNNTSPLNCKADLNTACKLTQYRSTLFYIAEIYCLINNHCRLQNRIVHEIY